MPGEVYLLKGGVVRLFKAANRPKPGCATREDVFSVELFLVGSVCRMVGVRF